VISFVVCFLKAKYDCFHNCMADFSKLVETLVDFRTPANGTCKKETIMAPYAES